MSTATSTGFLGRYLDYRQRPDSTSVLLMLFGAAGFVLGSLFVLYMLFTEGHAAFNTSSDVAWGAPIAFYLFFLLASSGLSVIASLDTVFGLRVFYPIAKRAVFLSIICLIAGFTILAMEIGRPFRMLWALPLALQVKSPMWWMGVFYSIDLVLLFVKFFLIHTNEWHSARARFVSVLSFIICILAPGTLGLVFGMLAMRPAWYSNIMPMYFILTGFTSAVAFMLFFTSLLPRNGDARVSYLYNDILPRLFFVAILAVAGMRFGQIVTGLWSNAEGMEANWLELRTPLFWAEILLALVVPGLLMAADGLRRKASIQFLAAASFMAGIFASRLHLLIIGQQVPLFKGYWTGFVEYWPSLTEWMLIPAGFGLFLLLYGAGEWLLRLGATDEPHSA